MRRYAIVLLFLGACGEARPDADQALSTGEIWVVEGVPQPDPPVVGDALLLLTIEDALTGEPPGSEAVVTVTPWMPDMGHGTGEVALEARDDIWEARFQYTMGGYWEVTVGVEDGDRSDEAVLAWTVI